MNKYLATVPMAAATALAPVSPAAAAPVETPARVVVFQVGTKQITHSKSSSNVGVSSLSSTNQIVWTGKPTQAVSSTRTERSDVFARLARLAELQDGWDGPRTRKLDPVALEHAELISTMVSPTFIDRVFPMPMPSGGIRFEWDVEDDTYIVELLETGGVYLCHLGDEDVDARYPDFDAETVMSFVQTGNFR